MAKIAQIAQSPVQENALEMLVLLLLLSNLGGILVRGLDGSGWLVSHGCRGLESSVCGNRGTGVRFFGGSPLKNCRQATVPVNVLV